MTTAQGSVGGLQSFQRLKAEFIIQTWNQEAEAVLIFTLSLQDFKSHFAKLRKCTSNYETFGR